MSTSSLPKAPKSVEEIVKDAQNFDHKTSYPLRITLRTAQSMLNQVSPGTSLALQGARQSCCPAS